MLLYATKIAEDVMAGRRDLCGNPWVLPNLVSGEAEEGPLAVTTPRPRVFIWAPEKLLKEWRLKCPTCMRATSPSELTSPRVVHTLTDYYLYVSTKHQCYSCAGTDRGLRPKITADQPQALACVPASLRRMRHIVSAGRILFDIEVLDHVRSMATRTSWPALADNINEMKYTSWARRFLGTKLTFLQLPGNLKVNQRVLRNLYMWDASERREAVSQELEAEREATILMMDWTYDAAAKCSSPRLFNVMSCNQKCLVSKLTKSCSPKEVESELVQLKHRGVMPRLVYVDDHCCGVWKHLLEKLWPYVHVRLDGMHAIRRLARTTTSTQHPRHGAFCKALADAIYTYDSTELERLQQAWKRAGHGSVLPAHIKKQYVPRRIIDPTRTTAAIEGVLCDFGNSEELAQALLTAATNTAWGSLRRHVAAGCLCDPPGIDLNSYGATMSVGGDDFQSVASMRGSSALEGFHSHQKGWLGQRAIHSVEAGEALLRDGAVRWNRKRSSDSSPVYDPKLLRELGELNNVPQP